MGTCNKVGLLNEDPLVSNGFPQMVTRQNIATCHQ